MKVANAIREQLEDRRHRLTEVARELGQPADLMSLLQQVDAALDRLDGGTFGRCLVCTEEIDGDDLRRNPVMQYCLCELDESQQRSLERDLGLAERIQAGLLPLPDIRHAGWEAHYRYRAAGPVGGDFCDLARSNGDLCFAIGDVSGKGIAASLLMAHLSAAFRADVERGAAPEEMVARADRLLLERALSTHYATLIYGRASADGSVSLCNAGHCPPVVVRDDAVEPLDVAGMPVGLFDQVPRTATERRLGEGDVLALYTDGVTELRCRDEEFGTERFHELLRAHRSAEPQALVARCLDELARFAGQGRPQDDLTLLVLRRDER